MFYYCQKIYKDPNEGNDDTMVTRNDIYDAIVAVLCKKHFKRVAVRPDIKLIHTIAEAAMQSRQQV